MIGRIEVQNDIAYFRLPEDSVTFPISHKRAKKTKTYELPSNEAIDSILNIARESAVQEAADFGMESNCIDHYEIQSRISNIYNLDENDNIDEYCDDDDGDELSTLLINDENISNDEHLDEHDMEQQEQHESREISIFTDVVDENGIMRTIRKSTLVWLLTEPGKALSKDRLRRVQVSRQQ